MSCDGSLFGIKKPKPLDDPRFNGSFIYSYRWEDSNGIEEDYDYISYTFDGTNKVRFYTVYYSYRIASGWLYSGNYVGDSYSHYYEFEIKDGQYRYKIWDNKYSSWYDWEPYTFSPDGETLTLHNIMNLKGIDDVLTKRH